MSQTLAGRLCAGCSGRGAPVSTRRAPPPPYISHRVTSQIRILSGRSPCPISSRTTDCH
ncbi:hypothetical protein JYU34_016735 [Plutella xylostella]|uniref:Uncharacterized protein n=1 Tax=Plutella xylostella TaxID=51655 RepID=A0ABQ7Q4A8_PLUXY|nr:hypothetical protein JYU34_016735 [Plutella xylostella]